MADDRHQPVDVAANLGLDLAKASIDDVFLGRQIGGGCGALGAELLPAHQHETHKQHHDGGDGDSKGSVHSAIMPKGCYRVSTHIDTEGPERLSA